MLSHILSTPIVILSLCILTSIAQNEGIVLLNDNFKLARYNISCMCVLIYYQLMRACTSTSLL